MILVLPELESPSNITLNVRLPIVDEVIHIYFISLFKEYKEYNLKKIMMIRLGFSFFSGTFIPC